MAAGNPQAWKLLTAESTLEKPNAAALAACQDAAAKTKKEQRCSIVVPVP